MKKLLIGLLVLGSFSSFASCKIEFDNLSASSGKVVKTLEEKGYQVVDYTVPNNGANYTLGSVVIPQSKYTIILATEFFDTSNYNDIDSQKIKISAVGAILGKMARVEMKFIRNLPDCN